MLYKFYYDPLTTDTFIDNKTTLNTRNLQENKIKPWNAPKISNMVGENFDICWSQNARNAFFHADYDAKIFLNKN